MVCSRNHCNIQLPTYTMEYRGLNMSNKSPIATIITIDYNSDRTSSAPSPINPKVEKHAYLIFINNLDIDIKILPTTKNLFLKAEELIVRKNGGMNAVRVKNSRGPGSYSYEDGLKGIFGPRTGTIDIS